MLLAVGCWLPVAGYWLLVCVNVYVHVNHFSKNCLGQFEMEKNGFSLFLSLRETWDIFVLLASWISSIWLQSIGDAILFYFSLFFKKKWSTFINAGTETCPDPLVISNVASIWINCENRHTREKKHTSVKAPHL